MNNELQEKLQLYKEGKLKEEERAEIEEEINKFIALSDYLNEEDLEFLNELKEELPKVSEEKNKSDKLLKRRVNLRIIMMTAASALLALVVFIFIYFSASKVTNSLFALDYKEAYVKREAMVQLSQMFKPEYKASRSSVDARGFAKQNIRVYLENTLGNTKIEENEISVGYSFGKPVKSGEGVGSPLIFENFNASIDHESDPVSGFKVLQDAPKGTKAKIFIEFKEGLTPEEIKENFIDNIDSLLDITPIAKVGSDLVLANPSYYQFTTAFPYDKDSAKQLEGRDLKQNQYENMETEAHKESLVGNLNLIKNNLNLLQAMYYEDMFENLDLDNIIKQVENNGAEYVGMFISADSKELLKLKENQLVHCMRVQNIVIW